MQQSPFDPYTYQPQLRFWYEGTQHSQAIDAFGKFIQKLDPQKFAQMLSRRPDLFRPSDVIPQGKLSAIPERMKAIANAPMRNQAARIGFAGLGQTETAQEPSLVTEWGNNIFDLAKQYFQLEGQRDIIKLNIARAEQGLPPISAESVAPQVNVGLSPETQKLAIYGLVGVGLIAAFMAVTRKR